ncbi:MAG: hypothetical protein OEZ28_00780 [Nitrospinota bacterium]|nr:hypothetical protein [Nitrospinota bacterium]
MADLYGAGWIDNRSYGCARTGSGATHQVGDCGFSPRIKEILPDPFPNFGRLDAASKATCYSVALALEDAGLAQPLACGEGVGIIGAGQAGCARSDVRYYKDYIDSGRASGLSNFFIYTLPSSPVSEASIHFGLQGPLLYTGGTENIFAGCAALAMELIENQEASVMLAGESGPEGALFMVLAARSSMEQAPWRSGAETMAILRQGGSFPHIARKLADIGNKIVP